MDENSALCVTENVKIPISSIFILHVSGHTEWRASVHLNLPSPQCEFVTYSHYKWKYVKFTIVPTSAARPVLY